MYYDYAGLSSDHWGEITLADGAAADNGIILRASADAFFVFFTLDSDTTNVRYYDGTAYQTIGGCALGGVATNDVLRFECAGTSPTSLRVFKNNVQKGSTLTTSSGPASGGMPGVFCYSTGTNYVFQFQMGDFSAPFTLPPGAATGDRNNIPAQLRRLVA